MNMPPGNMMGFGSCCMLHSTICKEGEQEKRILLMAVPHISVESKLYNQIVRPILDGIPSEA